MDRILRMSLLVIFLSGCVALPNAFDGVPEELKNDASLVRCTAYSVDPLIPSVGVEMEGCQCVSVGTPPGEVIIKSDGCEAVFSTNK